MDGPLGIVVTKTILWSLNQDQGLVRPSGEEYTHKEFCTSFKKC
jgi:hypothetical protein